MPDPVKLTLHSHSVLCFGEVYGAQTFTTICANPLDNRDFLAVHPDIGRKFTTWATVLEVLMSQHYITPVVEIHAEH